MAVLDVGAGREPTVPAPDRHDNYYVGLDISRAELERAPESSYDRIVVADARERVDELAGSFDLVLSFQVLEHVKPLEGAIENFRSYLKPGGRLLAQLSGTFSLFGLINRVVPAGLGVWAMRRLLGRDPETVFPAHYDHCWHTALRRMLEPWSQVDVGPLYTGGGYFGFWRPLQAAYLGYEEWTLRGDRRNLASYYVIDAVR